MRLVRLRNKQGIQPAIKVKSRKYADGGAVPDFDPNQPFDAVSSAPAFDPSKPFDPVTKSAHDDSYWSLGKQALFGVGRGLSGIVGGLGEAVTARPLREAQAASAAADAVKPQGINQSPEGPTDSELRQQAYRQALTPGYGEQISSAVGLEGKNAPQTPAERIASGVGEGASGAVLGGPFRGTANAVIGGIGGATGKTAAEYVPEPYKPAADIIGNLVGGAGAASVASGVRGGVTTAARLAQPLTREGQQTLAGRYLESRSSDPVALRAALDTAPPDIVPGSKPTTFQQTGDMGLGSLEREVSTKNPAEFMQRRAEQNAARLDALGDIQTGGNPVAVARAVRSQLDDVDKMTQNAVDGAMKEAQSKASALGGHESQDVYGSNIRGILRDAETEARMHERALWDNVDPKNDLTLNMVPVQKSFGQVYGNLSEAAQATIKPIEQTIANVIGEYKPVEPFRELTDLRSLVSSSMREELAQNGQSPAYSRLSRLRGGIENSINDVVGNRAIADAANIAAGKLAPEQSLAAIIQRQISDWKTNRGLIAESGTGETGAVRAPSMPSAPRGIGSGSIEPANVTGNPSVQTYANFDKAAAERLKDATAATRERAQTFNASPLKGISQREGQSGPYRMRESSVPEKIFHPGDTGFEDVRTFRKAVGDEKALPILRDYAASSLRSSTLTPEGAIDPTKFARWKNQHAEALRAFPAMERQFSDAASATSAVGDYAALRKSALQESQEGALGKFIGINDAQDVTRTVGSMFSGPSSVNEVRRLIGQIRKDPDAVQGLRKAAVDHMMQKFVSNAEAATTGRPIIKADQLQNFIKANEQSLGLIFTPTEMNAMRAISDDLQRANRSITAVRLPGGSNTAQDLTGIKQGQSMLAKILIDGAATAGGWLATMNPLVGAATGAGAHVANAMRTSGFAKVDDLVKQAMLDPSLAKHLLSKAPNKATTATDKMFASRLMFITGRSLAKENENIQKKEK